MRVSVMDRPGVVSLHTRPVPEPGPGDVLVRVTSVGVCGSDVHWFLDGGIGSMRVTAPLVLGHEAAGVVEQVGAGVADQLLGARVSLEPGVPCRRCAQCHLGRYNLCPDMRFMATPPIDGAFAEYVVLPSDFVYPVPAEVSDEAAALLEPLSVGIWANRKAGVGPGSRVLVTGAGPIGLVATQVALAFGAAEVVVTDVSEARLAVAETFGALAVDARAAEQAPTEMDAVLECSGSPAAITTAFAAAGRAARVVLVGMGPAAIQVPLDLIQLRELTVGGVFRYANTWPLALKLVLQGKVDLDRLVTSHHGLDGVEAALRSSGDGHLKSVVHPHC